MLVSHKTPKSTNVLSTFPANGSTLERKSFISLAPRHRTEQGAQYVVGFCSNLLDIN